MSTLTMPGRTDALAGKGSDARRFGRTLARRLIAGLARLLSIRRSARALEQLDDRMLRDIGLQRAGLFYAAHADCNAGR